MSRNSQGKSPYKGKSPGKPKAHAENAEASEKSEKSEKRAESPWAKAEKRKKSGTEHTSRSKAGRRKTHGREEERKVRGDSRPIRRGGPHSEHRPTHRPSSPRGEVVSGIVSAHPDGFGFVDVAGREKGVFLPHEEMRSLMHGDTVEVRVVFKRGRESGEYVRTITEAAAVLVGQFNLEDSIGLVQPRSRKIPQAILIKRDDANGAHSGDWVRVEVQRGTSPLTGKILEVLGSDLTPERLIDLVVAEQGLSESFPVAVESEAAGFADEVSESDCQSGPDGRMDLTHLPFVTIDGEDARDFDDAICVVPRGEGFEAWVAIADVAHYVKPKSALDEEALERGNSFYFPDRVIPMLPEKLSNGLCSLKPKVKRLAMVARMRFDASGKRRSSRMYEAVIYSHARLTYTQVAKWLEDGDRKAVVGVKIRPMLEDAARLFHVLERCREIRGALDLDLPETRPVLKDNEVLGMAAQSRNIAHKLIEELMLAANTAVAEYLESKECALLYRVHPAPERESIDKLNEFLGPLGLNIKQHPKYDVRPSYVQTVLEKSEGKPYSHVLHRLILRSMQQAKYTTNNEGHFGLAYKTYGHFTSPIRRYADLTVHRRLKALLKGENPDSVQPAKDLEGIGLHVSVQERKQQRGEWDTQAMLAALYHGKDIGKTMSARISGLSKRRVFLELESSLAEASMAVDDLGGMFTHDEVHHRLVARHGGQVLNLGDQLDVMLDSTDPVRGMIQVRLL
ncbi:MAG: ribonuclease R [Mariprofundaceae bacterium]|nr:ribonuclease R [Mariprofundaceae bacterium]